jgi:hypothetical protein
MQDTECLWLGLCMDHAETKENHTRSISADNRQDTVCHLKLPWNKVAAQCSCLTGRTSSRFKLSPMYGNLNSVLSTNSVPSYWIETIFAWLQNGLNETKWRSSSRQCSVALRLVYVYFSQVSWLVACRYCDSQRRIILAVERRKSTLVVWGKASLAQNDTLFVDKTPS